MRKVSVEDELGELLSIDQTARRLGLKPVTVRLWVASRRIARVKLGRRVLIPASEISRLIVSNLQPALPETGSR